MDPRPPVTVLAWHLTDPMPSLVHTAHAAGCVVEVAAQPGATGDRWADLAVLYRHLRDVAAVAQRPLVTVSGDCVALLAVLAAVQSPTCRPALVWFDAHGDFHTEATTTSGYLGGLPLAKAVGRGDDTLARALGLWCLDESAVVLVGARDLDPAEREALGGSMVRRTDVEALTAGSLPTGPVVVHVDLDVLDPTVVRGLRFPAAGGVTVESLVAALRRIAESREVVALDIAATWHDDPSPDDEHGAVLAAVVGALTP